MRLVEVRWPVRHCTSSDYECSCTSQKLLLPLVKLASCFVDLLYHDTVHGPNMDLLSATRVKSLGLFNDMGR